MEVSDARMTCGECGHLVAPAILHATRGTGFAAIAMQRLHAHMISHTWNQVTAFRKKADLVLGFVGRQRHILAEAVELHEHHAASGLFLVQ